MSAFGAWCDANSLTPTMENADKFAESRRTIPDAQLAKIARDIRGFLGGKEWEKQLMQTRNEEFHQWELLMIAQIIARGVKDA